MKKLLSFLALISVFGISYGQFSMPSGNFTINSAKMHPTEFGFANRVPDVAGWDQFQLTKSTPGKNALFQDANVWCNNKIDITKDFKITTQLYFGSKDSPGWREGGEDEGGDGIKFVMQNIGVERITLQGGGTIGYWQPSPALPNGPSFDVEFDTFDNNPSPGCIGFPPASSVGPGFGGPGDIKEDHIAFARDGSYCHNLSNPVSLLGGQVEDGLWHDVVFEYNATTKLFTVTFDGSPYSLTIDLKTTIFAGATEVYWGFTSGTFAATNDQRVRIFKHIPTSSLCDYNILAISEAKFYDNNSFDGNVGVRDSKGKAEFKKNTILTPGFVKAFEIKVDPSGSNVPNQILTPDLTALPTVNVYAGNPDGFSNLDVAENFVGTINGNYKDVKVKKGANVTLTGTDFKKVEIEEGAKVTFTQATIDIKELKASGKDVAPAKICFTNTTGCTNVRIGYKAELGYYAEVNKGLAGVAPVVFYLATSDNKSIDFKVKKGSYINASAYTPNGKIDVEGDQSAPTTMFGTYIADKVDAGKYVTWLKGNCCFDFTPPSPPCTDGFVSPDPAKKDIVKGTYTITDNGAAGTVTIRTTLAKTFTDNSYGSNLVNWGSRSHSFGNLTGSDKMQLALYNAGGAKSMEFVMDYLNSNSAAPSGFSTLGVTGGDGKMLLGNVADVVNVKTSISENLKLPVFQTGFTTNSPAANNMYVTTNPAHSAWIFDVWYEVTVKKSAFPGGFGYPMLSSMHASPSKTGNNSEDVVPCTTPRPINNDLVLGLEEQSELRVHIAPNPTNSYFQLKLQSSNQEKVIVRIMDAFGRPVKVLNNVQSNTTLVIGDDLKPGNYFAEIIQGKERKVVKLIKM